MVLFHRIALCTAYWEERVWSHMGSGPWALNDLGAILACQKMMQIERKKPFQDQMRTHSDNFQAQPVKKAHISSELSHLEVRLNRVCIQAFCISALAVILWYLIMA